MISVKCQLCNILITKDNKKRNFEVIYLMAITQGVLAQSPLAKDHDKVLDKNPNQMDHFTVVAKLPGLWLEARLPVTLF